MLLSLNLVVVAALTVVLCKIYTCLSNLSKARQTGCKSPPRLANWDIFFALDYFIESLKGASSGEGLTNNFKLLRQRNCTYLESSLFGTTWVKTANPENLRTFFSTKYADWGVEPFWVPGFKPCVPSGFLSYRGT